MTQLTEEAKRLLELAEKATPGPWFVVGPPWNDVGTPWINAESEDPHGGTFVCDLDSPDDNHSAEEWERVEASADFIAVCRELAPALADAYLAQGRVKEAQMEYVGSLRIKIAAQERVIEALVRVLPAIERYAAQDHGDISGPSIAAFEDAVETLRAAVSVGSPETSDQ